MLTSLQLVGFKSFAEKTRLVFPQGVTVVVGPNGSGKSNVVDAVKWVLGSQSPRSLRGKEMTDVIFNGSESRSPLASAEVTLAFDNRVPEAGGRRLFADVDHEEVRLTRRVNRSGEGEYLVNGRPCRLRDFRELLAGTGAGADSYSIIEQGRVDAALRASPLERRLLLEEAAGISRFRLKKREAARRLERVEQNLLRLSDIVDEVEGRLRRVRAQAGKARRYREASLRLKEARTELAAADWRRLAAERRRLAEARHALAEQVELDRAGIAEQEQRLADARAAATGIESHDRALRVAQQRVTQASRRAATADADRRQATDGLLSSAQRLLAARRELAAAGPDDQAIAALQAADETARQYESALAEARREAEESQRQLDSIRKRHTLETTIAERVDRLRVRCETKLTSLRQRRADAARAAAELDRQTRQKSEEADAAIAALADASSQRDAAADRLLRIDHAIAGDRRRLAERRNEASHQAEGIAEQREELVGLRHSLASIEAEQKRLERLNADVGRMVDASDATATRLGVEGLVADLIHVEADFAPLVEAALAERAEHVVVDSRSRLVDALLSAAGAGGALSVRAGFQALDSRPPALAVDQIDLSDTPGVVGRAVDFVEVEPRHADLARRLFGRTWFVDDLETAVRLSEGVGRGLSFVTLSGESLTSAGAIVCGPRDAAASLLTRREDAQRLKSRLADAQRRVAESQLELERLRSAVREVEQRLEAHTEAAAIEREHLASAAQRAAALEERRRHQQSALLSLQQEAALRRDQTAELQQRIDALAGRLQRLAAAPGSNRSPSDTARLLAEAQAHAARTATRVEELSLASQKHTELLESLRAEAKGARRGEPEVRGRVDQAEKEWRQAERSAERSACESLRESARVADAMLRLEEVTLAARQDRRARAAAEQIVAELSAAVAQGRGELDAVARRLADAELQSQRAELEAQSVARRVRDDYGIDVTEPRFAREPEGRPPVDRSALREEIDRLRREVESTGAVNLAALEELDELETRFATLSEQYNDLSQAKKSLAGLTSRIDADSRELFQATFETVRGHFRELFARLFGGGEADLLLVDPPDGEAAPGPLDGGVEIVACPPGKELRSLTLLSGGEKTMTCVALLLALFRSRPSPFCLLDEVDAALDEANVGRFLEVLKDFLGETQFIVITHSKRTMAGADTLYGVTMQESGVSKQISVRFEDVGEDGVIRLDQPGAPLAPALRAA
ncbi:chromosome segregation protein SMC [Botrimarina sp.]|uniref:chromosome segregation protein SMC n=1 Tax=Botrimarina sp. TaxID=2795802 RepID=UPI0032EF4DC6